MLDYFHIGCRSILCYKAGRSVLSPLRNLVFPSCITFLKTLRISSLFSLVPGSSNRRQSQNAPNLPKALFQMGPISFSLKNSPLWHQPCHNSPGRTKHFGPDSKVFFLTIITLDNFKSQENHLNDLLLHILLTSSIPATFTAALRTSSQGCSMELSSCNYFTSDILE